MLISQRCVTIQKTLSKCAIHYTKKAHLAIKVLDIFKKSVFAATFVKLAPYPRWYLKDDSLGRI